jgi:excinuclease UvrABC helicase subunit UvrB
VTFDIQDVLAISILTVIITSIKKSINHDNYQRGNQNPYIEEEQTTQWSKEKRTKEQITQWSKEKKYKRTNKDLQKIHINKKEEEEHLLT